MESEFTLAAIGAFSLLVFSTLVYLAKRYQRCPSDKILVVYGRVGKDQAAKCIHGGAALILPLIQDHSFLSLTPITMNIPLQNALSQQNIRVHVPSTFTVGISTQPNIMQNAAERLLGLKPQHIEGMAQEIIFGQLRLTVASLTIEEINQDRERFLTAIRKNVEPELNKIGLYLINVNITDITDESNYIESIGKKAASEAINQAMVDVAEQDKMGAIGQAEANREKEIRVAESLAEATKGKKKAESERRVYIQDQEASAIAGENLSKARIAESSAELAAQEAAFNQKSAVAQKDAEVKIQAAQYKAELERLRAEEVVTKEIEKQKIEIAASAEAERLRLEAQGKADAERLRYEAEARGIEQVLSSKAKGYEALINSCGGDTQAAATLLMIERLDSMVQAQVEAVKNLKIDKITVWDSGNSEKGSATANFISSLTNSLPPLQNIASMAGIELPSFLGRIKDASNPQETPAPKANGISAKAQEAPLEN